MKTESLHLSKFGQIEKSQLKNVKGGAILHSSSPTPPSTSFNFIVNQVTYTGVEKDEYTINEQGLLTSARIYCDGAWTVIV